MLTKAERIEDGAAVHVTWEDGLSARFHGFWLRDNARDGQSRAASGQKLFTLLETPERARIEEARAGAALEVLLAPEGKRLSFDAAWLRANIYDRAAPATPGWLPSDRATFDATLDPERLAERFDAVRDDDAARARFLGHVRRYGFALLKNGPIRDGALEEVVDTFGYVRETNYGRKFEVRTEIDPTNLAYTSLGLEAHTDNPYRDPIPTLQVLYCLENSAEGGDSSVVDGFGAAQRLRDQDPDGFALLSGHCARFAYSGAKGVALEARRPLIELAPDGELIAVRFNNRSAAAITDVPYERMDAYYQAYRRMAALINDDDLTVRFALAPGDCFIVDNTRVLHGRTGYGGVGSRWLQGCYADKDGLFSTLRALEARLGAAA